MEQNYPQKHEYQLNYQGKGSELFSIIIVNWLLSIVTLGLYYPWAKAKQLSYLYGSSTLNNDSFTFHGTGKEMFKGFIKAIILFIILYGILFIFTYFEYPIIGFLIFYFGFLALVPLAIHSTYKYRMSRTTWRGIRFGYNGDRSILISEFVKGTILTLITFGIYGPWFAVKLRSYIFSNIKLGSIEFNYDADGGTFFWLIFKGYLLSVLTFGIYSFWWMKDLFEFFVDNLSMHKEEEEIKFESTATVGGFFSLIVLNFIILIFTLGLGYAWVVTRNMKFYAENIQMDGNIDLNAILQTEADYSDATGEDVSDFLDLDLTM